MVSYKRLSLGFSLVAALLLSNISLVQAQYDNGAGRYGSSTESSSTASRYGAASSSSTPTNSGLSSSALNNTAGSTATIKPLTSSKPRYTFSASSSSSRPAVNRSAASQPTRQNSRSADSHMALVDSVNDRPPTKAQVSKGSGKLPNSAGQVWREYDIRPYTLRAGAETRPQQAIIDWILRETGYESWHSETFGILNANSETLSVYHTPAMQAIVADVADRFVNSASSNRSFSMRIVTVKNPNWRTKALGMMTPIPVQSPGLQGWIMPKENHALLLSELGRRSDLREYNAANQVVANGRKAIFSTMRQRSYMKGIVPTQNAWPGYQPEMGQLEEGASFEFNPLLSMDRRTAEAVVKLRLSQIEKMIPVTLDLPVANGKAGQRMQIQVPQISMANLHERFRWPADQVLVLSMGMVATPAPEKGNAFTEMIPILKSPSRADALLFVEVRDSRAPAAATARAGASTASRPATSFSGRY